MKTLPCAEFETIIEPLVERTLNTTADLMREAGLDWGNLDDLLLVGGSSRIPLVAGRLRELAGFEPRLVPNPDELVAIGAALYAAAKSSARILDVSSRFDVVNVNAHSLGVLGIDVETKQRINKTLIPRNSPLPAFRTRKFVTYKDGQKNVKVRLLEGESENPAFCAVLGDCYVKLNPALPKGSSVEVTCRYETDGTITVSARIPQTRESACVEGETSGPRLPAARATSW